MIKVVKIDEHDSDLIGRLFYESISIKETLKFLMSAMNDNDSDSVKDFIKECFDKSVKATAELEMNKKSVASHYKPEDMDILDNLNYIFNFETDEIEYSTPDENRVIG